MKMKLLDTLLARDSKNKLPSALLLLGTNTSLNDILEDFFRFKFCIKRENCKHCVNCKQIKDKQFYKIKFLEATTTNIAELRAINDFLQVKTDYLKFIVINNIDKLEPILQNVLLKNLEQPLNAVFLLVAEHAGRLNIIPTVRSRCTQLELNEASHFDEQLLENINKDLKHLTPATFNVTTLAQKYADIDLKILFPTMLQLACNYPNLKVDYHKILELEKLAMTNSAANKELLLENIFIACFPT